MKFHRPRLVKNWHHVLTKGYSAYGIYFAIAAQALWEQLSSVTESLPVWATTLALVGSLVGRIIEQKSVPS